LDEIEDWTDRAARRMYEGAGLGSNDVDIFNPYDGYVLPRLSENRILYVKEVSNINIGKIKHFANYG
jgi:hypothetical protein